MITPRWLNDRRLLLTVASLVCLLTAVRIAVFWSNDTYVDTVAGVWTAFAHDLAHGELYRPVVGPDGFGGTRYLPLFAMGQAALMQVADPVLAGHLMSLASVLLLLGAMTMLLVVLEIPAVTAASLSLLLLSPQIVQHAVLSIRSDALATGLGIAGLVCCVRGGRRYLVAAFVLFGLSVLTKVTSVAALGAAMIWLAGARRLRATWIGVAVTTLVVAGGLLMVAWISDGRLLESMAAAGGERLTIAAFLQSPAEMMRIARQAPESLVFLQAGAAMWLVGVSKGRWLKLPELYWVASMAAAAPIFAFEGADTNHLVEPLAASTLLVGLWAGREASGITVSTAVGVVAALAASMSLVSGLARQDAVQRWPTLAATVAAIPNRSQPILAENPAVAIAAGQRPYMLDPFFFRLMREGNAQAGAEFDEALRGRRFSAVVLERDPHDARGVGWYRAIFGGDFIAVLESAYAPAVRLRSRIIYLPKP